ncbi:MAG: hypothetical protein AB7P20_10270 [Rhizobiaceae bacterium]
MLTRAPIRPNIVERLTLPLFDGMLALGGRYAAVLGAVVFALYILATAAIVLTRPDANWDMLAYLAVAEESTISDPQQLHAYAYDTVRTGVSADEYRLLVDDGGGFRSHMAANAKDFVSLLPMYRVKFFYAELLSAMSSVMSPVMAMRVVSVVSVLLFGAGVLLWLRAAGALAMAPLFAGLLMMTEFGSLARASTPDLLCTAFMLGGLLAYIQKKELWAAPLLFLAFLVRPDSIIPLTVMAVMLVVYRVNSMGVLAGFAASLLAYFAISAWSGHPGWWPHLYFSSIEQVRNMDGFEPAFSIMLYAKAFVRSAVFALWHNTWLGAVVVAAGLWFALHRAGFWLERRAGVLFAATVLGLAAKFVAFPIHDTRIYFPTLIPLFLLLTTPALSMWRVTRGRGLDHGRK